MICVVFGVPGLALAEKVETVLEAGKARAETGRQAEVRIEKLSEEKRDLVEQYRAVLQEIEGLEVYNAQLERQVAAQREEMAQVDQSIERATVVDRQILPLMLRMIGALEQFVRLDVSMIKCDRRRKGESTSRRGCRLAPTF